MGNIKNAYSNNLQTQTLDKLQYNICETITSIEVSEVKLVPNNILKRPEVCLRPEGRHSEHLL
jgi:hypothetical protein